MANSWRVQPGSFVRYRDAEGRVHHAIVTAVASQETVDLRVGNGEDRLDVEGITRTVAREGAGWYRAGELEASEVPA